MNQKDNGKKQDEKREARRENPFEDKPDPYKNEPTITLIYCTKCKSFVGRGHSC